MPDASPFDHRPDRELGDALRQALSDGNDARFAQRVVAAADQVYGDLGANLQWWSTLTEWARPGLVAAMLVIAIAAFSAGLWVGRGSATAANGSAVLGDPLGSDSQQLTVPVLLAGRQVPDVDEVLSVALRR
jgi:hypothetical protein